MAGGPYLARVDLALQIAGTHHPVGEHAAAVQVAAQSLIQQLHCGFLQQFRLHHWGGSRTNAKRVLALLSGQPSGVGG